jgi:hypothetical protein
MFCKYIRLGHWFAIRDLINLKQCLACGRIEELYPYEQEVL